MSERRAMRASAFPSVSRLDRRSKLKIERGLEKLEKKEKKEI